MKATLLPLSHEKHYGSIIQVTDGKYTTNIKVWANADFTPSDRELTSWGYTREQWDLNAEVDDGYGGKEPIRHAGITSDGHFESQWQYDLCKKIIDAINA